MSAATTTTDSAPRAAVLYTPELLALAVSLADWPFDATAHHRGEARSPTCGSSLAFSCSLNAEGAISGPGLRVSACAVGQASAALFIAEAGGRNRADIEKARDEIEHWLAGDGEVPAWPGFPALEPARAYPARHGAILLAWNAALAALPKETRAS
jgi:NifU-like protein involved in Fe-S cluster formation